MNVAPLLTVQTDDSDTKFQNKRFLRFFFKCQEHCKGSSPTDERLGRTKVFITS